MSPCQITVRQAQAHPLFKQSNARRCSIHRPAAEMRRAKLCSSQSKFALAPDSHTASCCQKAIWGEKAGCSRLCGGRTLERGPWWPSQGCPEASGGALMTHCPRAHSWGPPGGCWRPLLTHTHLHCCIASICQDLPMQL